MAFVKICNEKIHDGVQYNTLQRCQSPGAVRSERCQGIWHVSGRAQPCRTA